MNYPDPDHNPACQCRGNPLAAFWCQFGHMLECHYPYTCARAACSHLESYDFSQEQIRELTEETQAAILAGQMPPYQLDEQGNVVVGANTEAVNGNE